MNDKPKRRWFRFSLRTLLVFVTITCAGFGWLGMKVRAKQREREAVKAIQKSGNMVKYDYERYWSGTYINGVQINPPIPPGPVWLRKMVGDDFFADVDRVAFVGNGTVDSDARHLRDLPQLRELSLDHSGIGDAGLVHLEGLNRLEELDLRTSRVTDAGLVHLAALTSLKVLYLTSTRVTDAGLVHLQGLSHLEWLNLYDTQVTDAGLVNLHELTKLKLLDVSETAVTDAGVEELLKALPNLNVIR